MHLTYILDFDFDFDFNLNSRTCLNSDQYYQQEHIGLGLEAVKLGVTTEIAVKNDSLEISSVDVYCLTGTENDTSDHTWITTCTYTGQFGHI